MDITKITNPIVRKALAERAGNFMFNYGEKNTPDTDAGHGHTEMTLFPRKTHQEAYNEYSEWYHDMNHNW